MKIETIARDHNGSETEHLIIIEVDENNYVKSLEELNEIIEEYSVANNYSMTTYFINFIINQINTSIYHDYRLIIKDKDEDMTLFYRQRDELLEFPVTINQELIDNLFDVNPRIITESMTKPMFVSFKHRKDSNEAKIANFFDKEYINNRYDWVEGEQIKNKVKPLRKLMLSLERKTCMFILKNYKAVIEFLENKRNEVQKAEEEKTKLYNKQYYESHREKKKPLTDEEKEKLKEYQKQYYLKRKEKLLEQKKNDEVKRDEDDEKIKEKKERRMEANKRYYEKRKAMLKATEAN